MTDHEAPQRLRRIDTHHHLLPPKFLEVMRDRLLGRGSIYTESLLDWTPARSIEAMDQNGIAMAVTSMSSGVWFGDRAESRVLARACNEYAARLAQDHPGRFGVFASLPLPDVEGSLREIEYAFDVLKADGIGLSTSYGTAWPGDQAHLPVFDELNRRKAVVYFHPLAPGCCTHLLPDIPDSLLEFPYDTTRAITSLLYGGVFARCPEIRFIFSHGGGALPMLAGRIAALSANRRQDLAERIPHGVAHELQKLYFDVVSVSNPIAMAGLLKLATAAKLLFGTDFPYVPPERAVTALASLGFGPEDLQAIEHDNAARLLPTLREWVK